MWKNWTPWYDERLRIHFDLYNSTYSLQDFIEREICIYDFDGKLLHCILKRVAWDNLKVELSDGRTITIHLTQEGRQVYPIQSITTLEWEKIYVHQDPNVECAHWSLDVESIFSEEQAYRGRILEQLQ